MSRKPVVMSRSVILVMSLLILAAPLFGLVVSVILDANLRLAHWSNGSIAVDRVCSMSQGDVPGAPGVNTVCYRSEEVKFVRNASEWLLVLTMLLPALYAALAFFLARHREWLARLFPWVIRAFLLALGILLIGQAVFAVCAAMVLLSIFNPGLLILGTFLGIGTLGLAYLWVAFLILIEAIRVRALVPTSVTGVLLTVEQMPELADRVHRIARKLGAAPPARIILGLETRVFATSMPLNLVGGGTLSPIETLYLPACIFRVLNGTELDALIAHELSHFRGSDQLFTQRFVPSYTRLRGALQTVMWEFEGKSNFSTAGRLASLPAQWMITGMILILAHAVNGIRRAREFEADQAAVEVSSAAAQASAIMKCSILMVLWEPYRRANAQYLGSGRARKNLSADYMRRAIQFLTGVDRVKFQEILLASRLVHPTDTHPILAERMRALGIDATLLFNNSIDEIIRSQPPSDKLRLLEESISVIENERMRIPGRPVVFDPTDELPVELGPRMLR